MLKTLEEIAKLDLEIVKEELDQLLREFREQTLEEILISGTNLWDEEW